MESTTSCNTVNIVTLCQWAEVVRINWDNYVGVLKSPVVWEQNLATHNPFLAYYSYKTTKMGLIFWTDVLSVYLSSPIQIFWNFCSSCRVSLEALIAKLFDREKDVRSCNASVNLRLQTNLYFELGIVDKAIGSYLTYLFIDSGRLSKAGFWKTHLWLLNVVGVFLVYCP